MRTILASLCIAFIFMLSLWVILLIWDINLLQHIDIIKIALTIAAIIISCILLCLMSAMFFNKSEHRYDKTAGKVAQPKKT